MQIIVPHADFVIENVQAENGLEPAVITLSLKDKPQYQEGHRVICNGHYTRRCQRIAGHDVIFKLPRMRSGREEAATVTFSFLPDFLVPHKRWCLLDLSLILFITKSLGFKSLWSFALPGSLESIFERVMNCFIGAKRCGCKQVSSLLQELGKGSSALSHKLKAFAAALKDNKPLPLHQVESYIRLFITRPLPSAVGLTNEAEGLPLPPAPGGFDQHAL